MTATDPNPWGNPPVAPELAGCGPTYLVLMKALHACSLADEELPSLAAIVAITDLVGDLIVNSGALWVAPDLVKAQHTLAEDLEQRRADEAPKPVCTTLREFFASARPPIAS
jgi:hypothetical protein